jgi:1,4-alpha-glucan branching enzyme
MARLIALLLDLAIMYDFAEFVTCECISRFTNRIASYGASHDPHRYARKSVEILSILRLESPDQQELSFEEQSESWYYLCLPSTLGNLPQGLRREHDISAV